MPNGKSLSRADAAAMEAEGEWVAQAAERREILRNQLGEVLWADRLAEARSREALLHDIERMMCEGLSRQRAVAELQTSASISTICRWQQRYAREGLVGLVDLRGQIARRQAAPDQAVRHNEPVPRSRRGRHALSFVKWAGSKASVAGVILEALPEEYGTYYEPMVGSGTIFLKLGPARAVLNDANSELINCYQVIRDQPDALLNALRVHQNTYEHFLRVRALDPSELKAAPRAARTIYLNKTCFNGLFRVNAQGRFNVPYGNNPQARIVDEIALRRIHRALQGIELRCEDYALALRAARRGDLVYLDPPYVPLDRDCRGSTKTFGSYLARGFDEVEHERLAQVFRDLDRRGCHVVLSNSHTPLVAKLYQGYEIRVIRTRRPVSADITRREGWEEVLVTNRKK